MKVYRITEFQMTDGVLFHTYDEAPSNITYDERRKVFIDTYNQKVVHGAFGYKYATELPEGAVNDSEKFLPYTATLTQDLPPQYKFAPDVHKGCKLLAKKHNGYVQFQSEIGPLVIALNSWTYKPEK